jgi:hypothetical protein
MYNIVFNTDNNDISLRWFGHELSTLFRIYLQIDQDEVVQCAVYQHLISQNHMVHVCCKSYIADLFTIVSVKTRPYFYVQQYINCVTRVFVCHRYQFWIWLCHSICYNLRVSQNTNVAISYGQFNICPYIVTISWF